MATDQEIIDVVERALDEARARGDNWADRVGIALSDIGVEVDEAESRARADNGYGPLCVLEDGRSIWQDQATDEITIEGE